MLSLRFSKRRTGVARGVCLSTVLPLCLYLQALYAGADEASETAPSETALSETAIHLNELMAAALNQAPLLQRSQALQQSQQSQAMVAGYWPKPTLGMTLQNLPLDTLDIHQEPMTQFQISLSQPLPQGQSLALHTQQAHQEARLEQWRYQLLQAGIAQQVQSEWVNIQAAQQGMRLVTQARQELQQLQQAVESRYRYASSATRQTELTILAAEQEQWLDRHLRWQQQAEVARQRLNRLLPAALWRTPLQPEISFSEYPKRPDAALDLGLDMELELDMGLELKQHPAWQLAQQRHQLGATATSLAREQDRPRWRLQAAYGHRPEDNTGRARADFVSLGVSVDMPWTNPGQSHHRVRAALQRQQADLSSRQQVERELQTGWLQWQSQARLLHTRLQRLIEHRLPLLDARIDAAEAAYRHDDGRFSDVILAQLARFTTRIEQLQLAQSLALAQVQLDYFLKPLAWVKRVQGGGYD